MKQKYSIFIDDKTGIMTIKEFAELDKGMFSLIFEETYENTMIQAAIAEGKDALIAAIRTPNLYPIAEYVEKIADTIIEQFNGTFSEEPVELVFNDIKLMQKEKKETGEGGSEDDDMDDEDEDEDDDSVEIDDLLDDDDDEDDDSEIDEDE